MNSKSDFVDHLQGILALGLSAIRPSTYSDNILPDYQSPKNNSIIIRGTNTKIPPNMLEVVTWNVFEGRKPSLKKDLEQLAEQHDVLLLQELPSPNDSDLLDKFSDWDIVYAPDFFYDPNVKRKQKCEHSGNAIVSRYSLHGVEILNLPKVTWDFHGPDSPVNRNAILASIDTLSGPLDLWNAHLEIYCRPHSRLLQAKPILDRLSKHPTILGMDTNAVYSLVHNLFEPVLGALEKKGFEDSLIVHSKKAFADYIFTNSLIYHSKILPLQGSDHYPISATISTGHR